MARPAVTPATLLRAPRSSTICDAVNFVTSRRPWSCGLVERGGAGDLGALQRQAGQRHRLVQVERRRPDQGERGGTEQGGARRVELGEAGPVEGEGVLGAGGGGRCGAAEGGVGHGRAGGERRAPGVEAAGEPAVRQVDGAVEEGVAHRRVPGHRARRHVRFGQRRAGHDEEALHVGPLEAHVAAEVGALERHRRAEAGAVEVDRLVEAEGVEGGGVVEGGQREVGRARHPAGRAAVAAHQHRALEGGPPGVDVAVDQDDVEVDGPGERHVGDPQAGGQAAALAPDRVLDHAEGRQVEVVGHHHVLAIDAGGGQAGDDGGGGHGGAPQRAGGRRWWRRRLGRGRRGGRSSEGDGNDRGAHPTGGKSVCPPRAIPPPALRSRVYGHRR